MNTTHTSTKEQSTSDVHSFSKPEEAVVKHLDLTLQVNFDTKILSGRARWDIENKTGASEIIFDTHLLTIEKVTLDTSNEKAEFSLSDSVPYLGKALHIKIKPGTRSVFIYYSTSPDAPAVQWLNPEQTAGKKAPFLFTQSQAILARTWVPCQDSPGIRFTYDASVNVPKNLLALMSAENPQQKNESGLYHFKMSNPIPSYLLALAVGDVEFKPISDRTGVYAEKVSLDKCVNEFADLEKMVDAAEKLYGAYAWGRYDLIVLPPSFPFGGMENPKLTFCTPTIIAGDRSLTSLVAHELAHSWSGNLVTNATWNDFWMNEGFTVYFENRIMEALYGKDFSDMQALLGLEDLRETIADLGVDSADTHLKLNLKDRDPDDGMNDVAYEKGHFLLLLIEKTIGREKFDAFLKNYFSRHAFKTITTEQFLEEYHTTLLAGDSAAAKAIDIERWIYQAGIPDNCPVIVSERFNHAVAQAEAWRKGASLKDLDVKKFSTSEWLRFLRSLPSNLSVEKMKELDQQFHFSESGNSEILAVWLEHVIHSKYSPAYPALESFLITAGRRKFSKPLFALLAETPDGLEMAKKIFVKAAPNYHTITRSTVEEIIRDAEKKLKKQ